jgi:hypothetical protein
MTHGAASPIARLLQNDEYGSGIEKDRRLNLP